MWTCGVHFGPFVDYRGFVGNSLNAELPEGTVLDRDCAVPQ